LPGKCKALSSVPTTGKKGKNRKKKKQNKKDKKTHQIPLLCNKPPHHLVASKYHLFWSWFIAGLTFWGLPWAAMVQ
jgi:hypothetical protein